MTVSEFLNVVNCESVSINNNGNVVPIDKGNALDMSAYGDYLIERADFNSVSDSVFCEITLKRSFLKKGA